MLKVDNGTQRIRARQFVIQSRANSISISMATLVLLTPSPMLWCDGLNVPQLGNPRLRAHHLLYQAINKPVSPAEQVDVLQSVMLWLPWPMWLAVPWWPTWLATEMLKDRLAKALRFGILRRDMFGTHGRLSLSVRISLSLVC